jgi:hypothetical protein
VKQRQVLVVELIAKILNQICKIVLAMKVLADQENAAMDLFTQGPYQDPEAV